MKEITKNIQPESVGATTTERDLNSVKSEKKEGDHEQVTNPILSFETKLRALQQVSS